MSTGTAKSSALVSHLKLKIAKLESRRSGTHAISWSEIRDLAKAYREIRSESVSHGLRILEDVLDGIDSRWRDQ